MGSTIGCSNSLIPDENSTVRFSKHLIPDKSSTKDSSLKCENYYIPETHINGYTHPECKHIVYTFNKEKYGFSIRYYLSNKIIKISLHGNWSNILQLNTGGEFWFSEFDMLPFFNMFLDIIKTNCKKDCEFKNNNYNIKYDFKNNKFNIMEKQFHSVYKTCFDEWRGIGIKVIDSNEFIKYILIIMEILNKFKKDHVDKINNSTT
jgi:hypothetical protein